MKDSSLAILNDLFRRHPRLAPCKGEIEAAIRLLTQSFADGGKLLCCGNGGSAADADHIVGELMKGFRKRRPASQSTRQALMAVAPASADYIADHLQKALPAISLTAHGALLSAYANDVAADLVFAQQVYGYGRKGDVLIALSTSGNSKNVLYAAQVARARGLGVIAFTGQGGGALAGLSQAAIRVPAVITHEVQELHIPVYHALCLVVENEFYDE